MEIIRKHDEKVRSRIIDLTQNMTEKLSVILKNNVLNLTLIFTINMSW